MLLDLHITVDINWLDLSLLYLLVSLVLVSILLYYAYFKKRLVYEDYGRSTEKEISEAELDFYEFRYATI